MDMYGEAGWKRDGWVARRRSGGFRAVIAATGVGLALVAGPFGCDSGSTDGPGSTTSSSSTGSGGAGGSSSSSGGGLGGSSASGQGGGGGAAGGEGFQNPDNPVGIGLVSPGNATQWDRAAELAGPGGHIKLIFPGVQPGMTGPQQDWHDAVTGVYARDLVPVIRMGPPWGNRNVRADSDDGTHMTYTNLAAAYAAVVAGLPLRDSWPLVIEVHNEPNLCYEWECDPNDAPSHSGTPTGWIHYEHMAAEYAAFLRDVTSAIRALGQWRILVINGGLAPGGAVNCECGGSGFNAGITSREFLVAMEAAVPGVHAALDGFASHSYPAQGEGWGFFEAYPNSIVGLHYFETELAQLGLSLPVYMTETGWTVGAGAMGSRQQVADWTVLAWENDWHQHADIAAVMPFMLQDPNWNDFAWVDGNNNPYPVFDAVKSWRCSKAIPEPCPG